MTQTPEDPHKLPETPSSVDLPNLQATQVAVAPLPTPTFVYTPPVTFSEQSAG
ncbi:MAG: hypothetical protein RJB51_1071, partial [Actinomycetota bacterium]